LPSHQLLHLNSGQTWPCVCVCVYSRLIDSKPQICTISHWKEGAVGPPG
jgi:hypothetical protein